MPIVNSHLHINPFSDNCFFYNDYSFEQFLHEMDKTGITIALPSLNPKLDIFRCPSDCSMTCPKCESINNNMENCADCMYQNKHRTAIIENNNLLSVHCKTCKKIIYTGIDPVRKYNIELLKRTRCLRPKVKPFVFLSICNSTIQQEIDFFEHNFANEFVGYKLHPWTNQASVKELHLSTKLPFLIHTGTRSLESTENALAFAKNHSQNQVVIAHAAQLFPQYLEEIANMPNVFIDCCPSTFMFKYQKSLFGNHICLDSPLDIYNIALQYVGADKILFGTDSPWGNSEDELNVIRSLGITEKDKNKILFENAYNLFSF